MIHSGRTGSAAPVPQAWHAHSTQRGQLLAHQDWTAKVAEAAAIEASLRTSHDANSSTLTSSIRELIGACLRRLDHHLRRQTRPIRMRRTRPTVL